MLRIVVNALVIFTSLTGMANAGSVAPQVSVPIAYVDNRPFVSVRVNGHRLRFLVDTGGYDTVDASVAKRLGLTVRVAGTIGGAGNGRAQLGTTFVKSLQLGTRTLEDQKVLVVDFSPIAQHLGLVPFDGMIGYDFFKSDIVTFLNSKSRLLIGASGASGANVAFSMYGTIPKIHAWVNNIPGEFILDTGDRSNATLVATFPSTHPAIKDSIARSNVVTGWGVGGPILSDILVLQSIRVSDLIVHEVVARIAHATGGTFSATDIGGTLGNGYLRRFDMSIDYPHKQLSLRRNGAWTAPTCTGLAAPPIIPLQECLIGSGRSKARLRGFTVRK